MPRSYRERLLAVHGNTLEMVDETQGFPIVIILITPSDHPIILREIHIDPDTVKLGDILTVQGNLITGTEQAPIAMVARVLLVGQQTYPQLADPAEVRATMRMMKQMKTVYLRCTGQVASFSPFVLKLADGRSVQVTIPGQTPLITVRPASWSEIRPGDRLFLKGAESKEGPLKATRIMIDATFFTPYAPFAY